MQVRTHASAESEWQVAVIDIGADEVHLIVELSLVLVRVDDDIVDRCNDVTVECTYPLCVWCAMGCMLSLYAVCMTACMCCATCHMLCDVGIVAWYVASFLFGTADEHDEERVGSLHVVRGEDIPVPKKKKPSVHMSVDDDI